MHRRTILFATVAISATLGLLAQVAMRPEFEVATVKPNTSGGNLSSWDLDHHGGFKAENTSLKSLVSTAYHVPSFMIFGPAWSDSQRYDINAKGAPGASDGQVRLMLQKLLEDRLRLRSHRETKEMSVYLMEAAGSGLKAIPADQYKPGSDARMPPGSWSALMTTDTLAEFAGSLSTFAGRPVVDRTGISGKFRLKLWFNNRTDSEGPDLLTALREQLGLQLRSGRAPVETLVVDSAEKTPTEN